MLMFILIQEILLVLINLVEIQADSIQFKKNILRFEKVLENNENKQHQSMFED